MQKDEATLTVHAYEDSAALVGFAHFKPADEFLTLTSTLAAGTIYGNCTKGRAAMVKVHEGVAGPQGLAQFLARHHLAWALQQHGQDLKRLDLQSDPQPVFAIGRVLCLRSCLRPAVAPRSW